MKTGKELKPGTVLRIDNDPWLVQKAEFTKSGRNSAIMKTKLKNLLTGYKTETVYFADDKLDDVILDRNPVFWVADPAIIGVAVSAAILVFFTAHRFESRLRVLTWLDALALSVAVPAGVGVALATGRHWSVTLIMGIATGCFGGLLRDVVCNEVPLVLKQGELYVTAAFAGAATALLALQVMPEGAALLACAAATFDTPTS